MKPYYEHAGITIYHGDSHVLAPMLPAGTVNAIVTSPPYNQMSSVPKQATGMWAQSSGGAGFVSRWGAEGYPDKMLESEYQAQQNALFTALLAACSDDASLFYNHQIRWRDGECLHPVRWFQPGGWRLRQEIVWNRAGGMMLNARMFVRFDERIMWLVRGDAWRWNQECVGAGTVWNIAPAQTRQGKAHPVAYPSAIPSRCIAATTAPGDLVLDPFMGGGHDAPRSQGSRPPRYRHRDRRTLLRDRGEATLARSDVRDEG